MKWLLILLASLTSFSAFAQKRKVVHDTVFVKTDTGSKVANGSPKAYHEVITAKAVSKKGLFRLHLLNNRYYFEIPDSLLGRDILTVNRIAKAATENRNPNNFLGFAGDLIGQNVIRFEKGPNNKVFIRNMSFDVRANDSSENGLYNTVIRSDVSPIVAAFDIKAVSPDGSNTVIDMTDFINSDSKLLFFNASNKASLSLGGYQADKSFIKNIKVFPINLEIVTNKTYSGPEDGDFFTYELNTSLVLLPKSKMKPRTLDQRIGYFGRFVLDYDASPQAAKQTIDILRWNLKPRLQDLEKYKRGELVEPEKPIVYYIDPTTPKKWVPYLIQGVNDWNKAFESAGFKNAIFAREAPSKEEDSTWSLEDARFSAIVYKPSLIQNASGPPLYDPRSGEILESHVNWYHNVMQLLHDWYFVQAAAIDPRARTMQFEDRLMGRLIRYVCSHEIGHTLGLRHNFGASSTVPVDSLRQKKWLKENGFCPSIMDYARFNYVAQPEDSVSEEGILPRIGLYDEWAIEWGYKVLPEFQSKEEEENYLNQWVIQRMKSDKRFWWGNELMLDDPRTQAEDLGDNAIKSGYYGIKNLRRISSHLLEWTVQPGKDYRDAKQMYGAVVNQYRRYLFHVNRYIGGYLINVRTSDQDQSPIVDFPSREKQKEAIKFLNENLFTTPSWLLDKKLYSFAEDADYTAIVYVQQSILKRLVSLEKFNALMMFESQQPDKAYTLNELLNDLKVSIWSELKTHKKIDFYRRNLQRVYVNQLISCLNGGTDFSQSPLQRLYESSAGVTDIFPVLKNHIKEMISYLEKAIPGYNNEQATKIHLIDIKERLGKALSIYLEGKTTTSSQNMKALNGLSTEDDRQIIHSHLFQNKPSNKFKGCWDANIE